MVLEYFNSVFLETMNDIFHRNKNGCLYEDREYFHENYFFSIKRWIQKDITLIAKVFERILNERKDTFFLHKIKLSVRQRRNKSVDSWKVNLDVLVDGEHKLMQAYYELKIILADNHSVSDYVKNGKKRKLLETQLYPNFLPENSEVITVIKVSEEKQKFIVGEDANLGRIGITTVL